MNEEQTQQFSLIWPQIRSSVIEAILERAAAQDTQAEAGAITIAGNELLGVIDSLAIPPAPEVQTRRIQKLRT